MIVFKAFPWHLFFTVALRLIDLFLINQSRKAHLKDKVQKMADQKLNKKR